ncbi:MAG: type IV pilus twitching motility protein PilT [Gaiella sp.]
MDLISILTRAVEAGASDVHFKLGQPPVMRYDGDLEPMPDLSPVMESDLQEILDEITQMTPKRRDLFEETGDLDTAFSYPSLPRFRVNGFRQRGATSFAFRIIPSQIPNFEQLHLPPGIQRLAEEYRGLILVTGPTGSGKTTTLASMLDFINRNRRQHIVTIEDPIEILHPDRGCIVNQREVGLDTESFQQGMRRVLRQDPDIILIGELRDTETAHTALQAAESGHLVFSTLHTLDSAESIGRMIEFFAPEKQQQIRSILAATLRGIVSQRLLPRAEGGRVPAVEIMVANARIEDLIRENRTDEITDAIAEGEYYDMQTFQQSLIDLVLRGEIDRDVAANAATNKHDFLVAYEQALKEKLADEREREVAESQRVAPASKLRLGQGEAPAPPLKPLGSHLR